MDEYIEKLLEEEIQNLNKLKVERLINEKSAENDIELQNQKVCARKLENQKQFLQNQLDNIQKENFSFQMNINSWNSTLKEKLSELKEAEFQLSELYKRIWFDRENFCNEADDFIKHFGVLSSTWKNRVDSVADYAKNQSELNDDKFDENKIKLQEEIEHLKSEIEILIKEKDMIQSKMHRHQELESHLIRTEDESPEVKLCDEEKALEILNEERMSTYQQKESSNELFSMMDISKMKMVNRIRTLRKKHQS